MSPTRTPRLKARVVIERDGQILCVLHAKPDQEPFWCLPGGNVDDGETLHAGAIRELHEEVGVEVETDGVILVVDGPEAGAIEVILRGTIRAGEPSLSVRSGDPYLADVAWIDSHHLPTDFRPPALRTLLQDAGHLAALPTIAIAAWSSDHRPPAP